MKVKEYLQKLLKRKLSKKLEPKPQGYEVYVWDNLPYLVWENLHNDISKIIIKGKPTKEQILNAWLEIYQGYINQCGLSPRFRNVLAKEKQLILKRIEIAVTGDRRLKLKVQILENELEALTKKKIDTSNDFMNVCKFFGGYLDRKTLLAKDYYAMVNQMISQAEKNKENEHS